MSGRMTVLNGSLIGRVCISILLLDACAKTLLDDIVPAIVLRAGGKKLVKDPDKNSVSVDIYASGRSQLISEKAAKSSGKTGRASATKKKKTDEDSIYFHRV